MDDQVLRAMRRWPNVPHVFGWLLLTARGDWRLVDRGMDGFDEHLHGAGSPITSPPLIDFISRNYQADEQGRWYWQNGPQRCFVDIERAPLILRLLNEGERRRLVAHTGFEVGRIDAAWLDEHGHLYLQSDLGPCALDDRDLARLDVEEHADGTLLWRDSPGQRSAPLPIGALGDGGSAVGNGSKDKRHGGNDGEGTIAATRVVTAPAEVAARLGFIARPRSA